MQICWLLLAVLILALTIYGYVQALTDAQQRLKQAQSGEQHDFKIGAETSTEQSSSNTKFIHALFCSALVVETFLVAHVAARIGRYLIYRAYYKRQEVALESMSQISEVNSNDVPPRPPSRFVQAFVGPPPTIPSPPKLPNYDHALRQAARQSARRQAARLGVSAGRRGREQFGSGDPEDLEIERIKRLGGLPPSKMLFERSCLRLFIVACAAYRSDEMRKSKIVLRGAKLERRSSILSMFSNSAASDEEPNAPSSPASQIGFSGFVHRLMSVKSINNSTYPTSSPNVGQTASLHMTEQSEEEQETPKHPEDKGHNIGGSDSRGTASKQLAREDDCLAEAFITSALPAEALTVILTHDRQELDSIKPDTS